MMMTFKRRMRPPLRLRRMSSERMRRGGNPKKEWIVWPPTFTAASPVGASTTASCVIMSRRQRSSVDLPVPARPVTNRWPSSLRAKSSAAWNFSGAVMPAGQLSLPALAKRLSTGMLDDTQSLETAAACLAGQDRP